MSKVQVLCHEGVPNVHGMTACVNEAVVLVDGTPACEPCKPFSMAAVRSMGNEPEVTPLPKPNAERKRLNHVRELAG